MQEAFLHYIWKYRKSDVTGLKLVTGQTISIINPGQHNQLAGPDFLDARIRIEDTLWAGHVEIHVNASDWYAHRHELDTAYENVILHVVWNNDVPVMGIDGGALPTLELQYLLEPRMHAFYDNLRHKNADFIPCEKEAGTVDPILLRSWLERLYMQRLQSKVEEIQEELDGTAGNWQATFFIQLAMGFGTKINKQAFRHMARQVPYRVLCRSRSNVMSLEALFMGVGGLLEGAESADPYLLELRKEYQYLQQKFQLQPTALSKIHFFKLRPSNFPTLRVSQLAALYHHSPDIMSQCMAPRTLGELHQLLRVATSDYWKTHYTFGCSSPSKLKITTTAFINTLVVNVVLPFKYAYLRSMGNDPWPEVLEVVAEIPPEKNAILRCYAQLGIAADSALESQAILQLYTRYCRTKRCLECAIGHQLLGRM